MDVKNILIVGVGGQGTILAGKVLSRAAVLSGLDVKFSEIHGMAQRGGNVVTQVRIGEKVFAPLIDAGTADAVVAFEQLEGLRWAHMLKPGGRIIVSTQVIAPMPVLTGAAVYPDDALERMGERATVMALDADQVAAGCGNARASNIVLMGCLARLLDLPRALWDQALRETIKARHLDLNLRAFEAGWQSADLQERTVN